MTESRGFQPTGRRRKRIAAGVLLAAIAVGGNVAIYTGLDDRTPVVQVTRDVPAGERLSPDMLRTVAVDADPTVNVIPGDRIDSLVGTYAKVRLVSGSLVTAEALQSTPLVAAGNSVVAIRVPEGTLPIGIRERAPVQLVVPGDGPPTTVPGRVVGLPAATGAALGVESLSVEVAADDAATVASADDVRVVLVVPSPDPAASEAGGLTSASAPADGEAES
ncbi:MAG TPA: SAF domain-containing protein [Ilumatobacteraceae bacterium]|nr:SAF domain-containing protein [Ilumatobacteraceae bacterium]